jgi:hypothetical protein
LVEKALTPKLNIIGKFVDKFLPTGGKRHALGRTNWRRGAWRTIDADANPAPSKIIKCNIMLLKHNV